MAGAATAHRRRSDAACGRSYPRLHGLVHSAAVPPHMRGAGSSWEPRARTGSTPDTPVTISCRQEGSLAVRARASRPGRRRGCARDCWPRGRKRGPTLVVCSGAARAASESRNKARLSPPRSPIAPHPARRSAAGPRVSPVPAPVPSRDRQAERPPRPPASWMRALFPSAASRDKLPWIVRAAEEPCP